jgi:hypothetical protein
MYICTNFDENYAKLKRLYHEMNIFLRTIKLNHTFFMCACGLKIFEQLTVVIFNCDFLLASMILFTDYKNRSSYPF